MNKMIIPLSLIIILTIFGCFFVVKEYSEKKAGAISSGQGNTDDEQFEIEVEGSGNEITAIVMGIDTENRIITIKDIYSEKEYSLNYIGATAFYNKYGDSIVPEELETGEITDVSFTTHRDTIKSISVSNDTWEMKDVVKYSIDEKKKIFEIADVAYKFTDGTELFSDGKKVEWMDITDLDTLTVRGIDKRILSIVVQEGHGYIRLINDIYFVGGYIEVGNEIIKEITEDMLIPAPEGDFHVTLTNKGYLGEKDVVVVRDRETVIDLKEIPIEEVAIGHVEFKLEPIYAQLYIDGEMTEYTDRVPLEYGVHSIRIEAAGYKSVTTSIKIGSEYANVEISLDADETQDTSTTGKKSTTSSVSDTNRSTSGNSENNVNIGSTTSVPTQPPTNLTPAPTQPAADGTVSTNTVSSTSSTSSTSGTSSTSTTNTASDTSGTGSMISQVKKIYIQQPEGVEVYLDGNYIGIAPASTNKVTGNHVITLSKSGFQTKSYTVNIDNDGNDITFSFSELSAEQ
ncbi:MAG: PEGA domain-containing protein [Lachnospiraceae bacterium]|nr:PEGA domain-containing protein [Lachnospiraceae bacterium]